MSRDDSGVDRRALLRALGASAVAGGLATGEAAALGADASRVGGDAARERPTTDAAVRARLPRYVLPTAAGPGPAPGDTEQCFYPNERKELYGPTAINGQSGNGGLSVAFDDTGTVTVFRWPSPSYYDHVKHYATDRDKPHAGAEPNEAAFLGLRVETPDGTRTEWLREWSADQRYADDGSDAIVTEHRSDELSMRVEVRDVVAPDSDALVRDVSVNRDGDSPVASATLLAFQNLNPVVTKVRHLPAKDWCLEETNDDIARFDPKLDAVVHRREGIDQSVGERRSVAIAVGFAGQSVGHQVGGDAYEEAATPDARLAGSPTRDAYDDASDGPLMGNDEYAGQTTSALARPINSNGGRATLVFACGETPAEAGSVLESVRDRRPERIRAGKRRFFDELVGDAPLPNVNDEAVLALCRRALVTLVTERDRETGAIVASIATQSPYGEDWPRDGYYFDYLLDTIGRHDWVEEHDLLYADWQQQPTPDESTTAIPPGNWAMNYYADGVPGGPIPFEIDETAYGASGLWDHYAATGDESYLRAVYPAIRRAGEYMVDCRDPRNGLHCRSWEDDNPQPGQSIVGAATVWRGLGDAAAAARELGRLADAERFEARRHELGRAIDRELYDADRGAYGPVNAGFVMSEVVWPLRFRPYVNPTTGELRDRPQVDSPLDHPRIVSHLRADWQGLARSFKAPDGGPDLGLYESKGLLALAKARLDGGEGDLEDVREGLRWVATRHATDDTHVMGEVWTVENDEVISIVSQPHAWEQILFYMAAIEAWPPAGVKYDADSLGGVLEAIRDGTKGAG